MSDLLYIAGAVALLALAALLLYLIVFIKEAKGLVANANKSLGDLSSGLDAQLQNIDVVVKNVGKLTDDLTDVVDDATEIIHEGKTIIVSILQLEQTLQRSVQAPLVELVAVFGALGKGIRAFRERIGSHPGEPGSAD